MAGPRFLMPGGPCEVPHPLPVPIVITGPRLTSGYRWVAVVPNGHSIKASSVSRQAIRWRAEDNLVVSMLACISGAFRVLDWVTDNVRPKETIYRTVDPNIFEPWCHGSGGVDVVHPEARRPAHRIFPEVRCRCIAARGSDGNRVNVLREHVEIGIGQDVKTGSRRESNSTPGSSTSDANPNQYHPRVEDSCCANRNSAEPPEIAYRWAA